MKRIPLLPEEHDHLGAAVRRVLSDLTALALRLADADGTVHGPLFRRADCARDDIERVRQDLAVAYRNERGLPADAPTPYSNARTPAPAEPTPHAYVGLLEID